MYMYNVHTHTNRSAQRRAVRRAEAACEEQQDEWDQELDEQQQLQQAEEAELLHNVRYTALQLQYLQLQQLQQQIVTLRIQIQFRCVQCNSS
jgi:hypothetical protein